MLRPINIEEKEWEKWMEAKEKVIQALKPYNLSCGAVIKILQDVENDVSGIAFRTVFSENVGNV